MVNNKLMEKFNVYAPLSQSSLMEHIRIAASDSSVAMNNNDLCPLAATLVTVVKNSFCSCTKYSNNAQMYVFHQSKHKKKKKKKK
jgi:hypothetical protein